MIKFPTSTRKQSYLVKFPISTRKYSYLDAFMVVDYPIMKYYTAFWCHEVAQMVQELRYKPESCGFDSRWGH